MRTQKVIVLPYDKAWQSAFENIRLELDEALGNLAIGIEHVGSTSVEGLSAKPCIDIDVIIRDYSSFDAVVQKLATIGYIHEGDLGIKDREAFTYMDKRHLLKHHLYVCPQNSQELHRHITSGISSETIPKPQKSTAKQRNKQLYYSRMTSTDISNTKPHVSKNYINCADYNRNT